MGGGHMLKQETERVRKTEGVEVVVVGGGLATNTKKYCHNSYFLK